jgi:trigger factor
MATMSARVEELPENKVRLTVDVPAHDVQHAVEHAASDLSTSVKIPGFRKWKVPMPVLLSRIGKERLYSEAVESHIEGWYRNALVGTRIRPVARPEYAYELPDTPDEDFSFTATVDVQPTIEVADWKGLEVPYAGADVPPEVVDQQIEALRFAVAELAPADKPAQAADTVVVDLVQPGGEAQRDYVVEVGAGRVLEEIEEDPRDVGRRVQAGRIRTRRWPEGHRRDRAQGGKGEDPPARRRRARALGERVRHAELRADLEQRIGEQVEEEAETQFRAAAADALVDASNIEPSAPLVEARTRELLAGLVQSLERRGISPETYLTVSNQTPEQLEERLRAEAARSVARELALEAVADKAGLEVTDDELREFVRENAEAEGGEADEVVEQLFASGRHELLREDLRMRKALDLVVAEVERIPLDLARAREKLWTPDKGAAAPETKLWTPGSKEPA